VYLEEEGGSTLFKQFLEGVAPLYAENKKWQGKHAGNPFMPHKQWYPWHSVSLGYSTQE
jgi:hypothetical protein